MAIARSIWKCGAFTNAEDRFAVVLYQRQLAFENVDEFVLVRVPMPLA
jgi:hypothetical protein